MIDLILFTFMAALFLGGFWLGQRYGSMRAMVEALRETVIDWFH